MDEIIKKAKKEYSEIKYVECPVLGNIRVHFTRSGFTHLIRKGLKERKASDQFRRLKLFKHVPFIIKNAKEIYKKEEKIDCFFITLRYLYKDREIKVVLRKKTKTEIHFFSVMDR